jgi:hypothetical protein
LALTIPPIKEQKSKPINGEIHDEFSAYFGFEIIPAPAKRQRKTLRRSFSGLNQLKILIPFPIDKPLHNGL